MGSNGTKYSTKHVRTGGGKTHRNSAPNKNRAKHINAKPSGSSLLANTKMSQRPTKQISTGHTIVTLKRTKHLVRFQLYFVDVVWWSIHPGVHPC